jgi:hypothetical protein
MDEKITLSEQMEEKNVGSVILINKFNVKPEEVDQFLQAWASDAAYLRASPDAFPHSSTAESEVVVSSSTMQFGNLLSCLRMPLRTPLRTLSCSRVLRSIHPV